MNLHNSFFHFLSKLKNFIVNLTIRLPFLKVTGTALPACWKKSELGEKNKKISSKVKGVGDGQGGALGAQHRAERRLQLEMPSRAAGSVDGEGRVISRGQWSQIYPHRNREKKRLPPQQLAVSHRPIGKIERGTVNKNGYFYIPKVQFDVEIMLLS